MSNCDEIKLKALELANIHAASAAITVMRAEEYYKFLVGAMETVEVVDEPQTNEIPLVEPGTTKARKPRETKSKVDAVVADVTASLAVAEAQSDTAAKDAAPIDPAAEYKKIQNVVVALVNFKGGEGDVGKSKVIKVLDQFGVPNAMKLTPEQYAEALSLLEAELASLEGALA